MSDYPRYRTPTRPNGNVTQPSLLDPDWLAQTVQPVTEPHATIDERFRAFHEANPHVYQALRRLALDLRRRGVRRYGMKGLFEVLRWRYAMQTHGDEFKLNNNYTSRYARLLMEDEPELAGFFETRELKSE